MTLVADNIQRYPQSNAASSWPQQTYKKTYYAPQAPINQQPPVHSSSLQKSKAFASRLCTLNKLPLTSHPWFCS